ncbi:unnamed protein product [Clonostachys byssicola]|uniref:F-box domain-containing protein n=1 Tax=Clonostachys byssicola TaxID=160290 RepID=A0A9N9Y2F0_9HYPO|nr:unnamed protein product [Clonostachys byssicola]
MAQRDMRHTATLKVFGTIEILEAILLHLDPKDLLLSQLISTRFKSIISTSPAIQQRLFLSPAPASTPPQLNPVLAALFPVFFSLKRPVDINQFYQLHDTIGKQEWYINEFQRHKLLRPDASWRRMFPLQPPAKLDEIRIFSYDWCQAQAGRRTRARLGRDLQPMQEPGIRMGLLYDLVVHFNKLHPDPEFYVHWEMFSLQPGKEEWQEERSPYDDGMGAVRSDYYPLFLRENLNEGQQKLQHKITLYYQHDALCGVTEPQPLLDIDSTITSMAEKNPTGMLHFVTDPNIELTHWDIYITAEDVDRIKRDRTEE